MSETRDEPVGAAAARSTAHRIEGITRPFFIGAEVVVYVLVGLAFLLAAIGMLGYSVLNFATEYGAHGFPSAVVTLINDLLLVMIMMEVLRTIVSYLEEQGTSLRPFLFIAAISATRRVLAIGAQMTIQGDNLTGEGFNQAMIDLGTNAGAILVIAVALYLLDRHGSAAAGGAPGDYVSAGEERIGPTA